MSAPNARVVLLAGPSGSGKSYVARRTGIPVLCLDEFYKDASDHTLPRVNGVVDWESPLSWDRSLALAAIAELAETGRTEVPIYDIGASARVGSHEFTLAGAPLFIAEGIFAADIVAACSAAEVLADAVALRRLRTVTFVRRLVRDLAEKRKPPPVLIRRGLRLWREDSAVLARQRHLGCRPLTVGAFLQRIENHVTAASHRPASPPR